MFRGTLRTLVVSTLLTFAVGCADSPPPAVTTAAQPPAAANGTAPGAASSSNKPDQTASEAPNADDESRVVKLDNALNVRDLGGLKGAHGPVPANRFIRTADLSKASDKDRQTLKDRGVTLDVDLRTPDEVTKKPDTLQSDNRFKYVNISLVGPGPIDFTKITTLADLYVTTLNENQAEFLQVFKTMASAQDGAVLYHCSAGKDRTGMVTAILLELAGVDRKEIIHNYAISGFYLGPVSEETKRTRPEIARIMGTPPEAMAKFLDVLDSKYGGAHKYLEKIGLSEPEIKALSTRLGQ